MNLLSKIYENCTSSSPILKLGAITVNLEQREENSKSWVVGVEEWVGVEASSANTTY